MSIDPSLLEVWNPPLMGGFLFVIGCCLGSFFNVCIYRIPLGQSVVHPRSRCASCGIPLKSWQNIPILGWAARGGWCSCRLTRIDMRYALVEIGSGILFWGLWRHDQDHPALIVIHGLFLSGLLIASLIDLDFGIIPDRFSLGGIAVGLAASALFPQLHGAPSHWASLLASGIGALAGGGLLYSVSVLGRWVFRKEAMGLGDVKLLAAMGAFLGWPAIFYIVAVSSLLGSVVGIACLCLGRAALGNRLPFGPFLSLAAGSWIFGGSEWEEGYFHYLAQAWTPWTH